MPAHPTYGQVFTSSRNDIHESSGNAGHTKPTHKGRAKTEYELKIIAIDNLEDVNIENKLDVFHHRAQRKLDTMNRWACLMWFPIIALFVTVIVFVAQGMDMILVAILAAAWLASVLILVGLRIAMKQLIKSYDLNPKENPHSLKWGARAWRSLIQSVIRIRADQINRYRLTRALQVSVPSLMPVEAYLLDRFMGALEDGCNVPFHMEQAFKNKNVGRIIVQALPIFDILWHNSTRLEWIKILDFLGDFPGTEIGAPTFGNVVTLLFRRLLGEGRWYTRYLTGNREELVSDGDAAAQNLAPANGLESVNRAQHGTHIGRVKTQEYRNLNRLPTDEIVIRAFFANPNLTIVDNGFEHTMRAAAKHWRYMLSNEPGNFGHQRQELLDPVNAMRVALPAIITQLIALRGINERDNIEMAPFVRKCELLEPRDDFTHLRVLVNDFKLNFMEHVCAGVPSRLRPLAAWVDCLVESVDRLEKESKEVVNLIFGVRSGIKLGIKVVENIDWKYPTDSRFKQIIPMYLKDRQNFNVDGITARMMDSALDKLNPKDKRTFLEFADKKVSSPEKRTIYYFLVKRIRSLVKREIYRFRFNEEIRRLEKEMKKPVAGMIAAAQEAWMLFELKNLRVFGINAFLDHAKLRRPLRDLQVVSQLQATELDESKIRNLRAMKGASRIRISSDLQIGNKYWFKRHHPHGKDEEFTLQSFDSKDDTFRFTDTNGQVAAFPWRTQHGDDSYVVSDALPEGWLALVDDEGRQYYYNLQTRATTWDKPSSAKTTSETIFGLRERGIYPVRPQHFHVVGGGPTGLLTGFHVLGSVLRSGGTMTISEKRDALRDGASAFQRSQVVRLDPRWIAMLRFHLGTRFEDLFVQLDGETMAHMTNFLIDVGFVELTVKTLEDFMQWGVVMRRSADLLRYNTESTITYDWKKHSGMVPGHQLKVGDHLYGFQDPESKRTFEYATVVQAVQMDSKEKTRVLKTELECFAGNSKTTLTRNLTSDQKFELDLRLSHFVIATGKSANTGNHFPLTTKEYYGVACLSGSKVSHVMHQMGVPRWKNSLINDIRSIVEDNTRLVGDFTKVISTSKIAEMMTHYVATNDWRAAAQNDFKGSAANFSGVYREVVAEVNRYSDESPGYFRETLQSRVFETGDNTYLGMEVNKEFTDWQEEVGTRLGKEYADAKQIKHFKKALARFSAKLFFQGAFDALKTGDVFNPGAQERIPEYTLIDSSTPTTISQLVKGDAFHVEAASGVSVLAPGRYELLSRAKRTWYCSKMPYLVRDMDGHVTEVHQNIQVYIAGDFARAPDGRTESKVAFATFPVVHYVNHSAARIQNKDLGVLYIPVGDNQSTPHFMRYSGLTGAAINAMEINFFVEDHIKKVPFKKRYMRYVDQVNWSNAEVVTRGIGIGYGEDGFLRPGFQYQAWLDFLYHKIEEFSLKKEFRNLSPHTMFGISSSDWMRKFACSLVPRRLEHNPIFQKAMLQKLNDELRVYMANAAETNVFNDTKEDLRWRADVMRKIFLYVVNFARAEGDTGKRISTEFYNQSNPLDSIADNQSPEVQAFINGFTVSATLVAGGLAAANATQDNGEGIPFINQIGIVFRFVGPILAFASVTNSSRYLRRNEDFQAYFVESKLNPLKEALHAQRGNSYEVHGATENDPFIVSIQRTLREATKWCKRIGKPLDYRFYKKVQSLWDKSISKSKNGGAAARSRLLSNIEEVRQQEHKRVRSVVVSKETSLVAEVDKVLEELLGKLISTEYAGHPYTQDALTALAFSLMDLRDAATESKKATPGLVGAVEEVLQDIEEWEPQARSSIEQGPVHFGLCRPRSCGNNYCARIGRFFRGFCSKELPASTLAQKTKAIIRKLRGINRILAFAKSDFSFEKEIRDLEEFYYASVEVNKVTLIMVAGFIAAMSAIVQSILDLLVLTGVQEIAAAALVATGILVGAIGPIPVIIGIFFLMKQQTFLWKPERVCGITCGTVGGLKQYLTGAINNVPAGSKVEETLMKTETILGWQLIINILRIIASSAAAAALISILASPIVIVGQLALVALIAGSLAFSLNLYIIYGHYYYLDEKAPALVVEAFKEEAMELYEKFLSSGKTYNALVENRTAWAYTARAFLHQYRFDTLFDVFRLNSMMQYIQSGMSLTVTGQKLIGGTDQKSNASSTEVSNISDAEWALAPDFPERVHLEELEAGKTYLLLSHGKFKPYRYVKMGSTKIWLIPKGSSQVKKFEKDKMRVMIFHPPNRKANDDDDLVSLSGGDAKGWDQKFAHIVDDDDDDDETVALNGRSTTTSNANTSLLRSHRQAASNHSNYTRGSASSIASSKTLPPGWVALRDDEGHQYYYNQTTKQSQWERPTGSHAASSTSGSLDKMGGADKMDKMGGADKMMAHGKKHSNATASSAGSDSGLPEGWIQLKDDNGNPYFYNTSTKESSWDAPKKKYNVVN